MLNSKGGHVVLSHGGVEWAGGVTVLVGERLKELCVVGGLASPSTSESSSWGRVGSAVLAR